MVANELVDWFNAVDAKYRADLKELNELNFSRFDSKLGERLTEFHGKSDKRFSELEARLEKQIRELAARFDKQITEFRAELKTEFGDRLRDMESRLGLGALFFRG